MNKKILITCVIIGHNTAKPLAELLFSINQQNYNNNDVEIIYVDDGSSDDSLDLFNTYNLKYSKKSIGLPKNKGRMFARKEGVKGAKGKWCLFLNSSIVLHHNLFTEYFKIIHSQAFKGYVGSVSYRSDDQIFESYLNHLSRGINGLAHLEIVPYYNILFSNCLIRLDVLKNINWNTDMKQYGGEELFFAFLIYMQHPDSFRVCKNALVYRNNHPSFTEHCIRMSIFGNNNFKKLNLDLQLQIIKYKWALCSFPGSFFCFKQIMKLSSIFYKSKNIKFRFIMIKIGLWASILYGYHASNRFKSS